MSYTTFNRAPKKNFEPKTIDQVLELYGHIVQRFEEIKLEPVNRLNGNSFNGLKSNLSILEKELTDFPTLKHKCIQMRLELDVQIKSVRVSNYTPSKVEFKQKVKVPKLVIIPDMEKDETIKLENKLSQITKKCTSFEKMDNKAARLALTEIYSHCTGFEVAVNKSKASIELKKKYLDELSEFKITLFERRVILLTQYSEILLARSKLVMNNTQMKIDHNQECRVASQSLKAIISRHPTNDLLGIGKLTEIVAKFLAALI